MVLFRINSRIGQYFYWLTNNSPVSYKQDSKKSEKLRESRPFDEEMVITKNRIEKKKN
jgi:hypothetical protein